MKKDKIRAGIFGISGYTGQKLVELLLAHPETVITQGFVSPERGTPEIEDIIPRLKGRINLKCENKYDWRKIEGSCDILFLALPHSVSMRIIPDILKINKKVVDLSADFRCQSSSTYEQWYQTHLCPQFLERFVYGLPEINRERIAGCESVANPGCYPTSAALALIPLAANRLIENGVIVDAKSGVTGAGRSLTLENIFAECNENLRAYKIGEHRHIPEIEETLSVVAKENYSVTFVPHLIPLNQGILSTCYATLKDSAKPEEIYELYDNFYRNEPFVRVMNYGTSPAVKNVLNTNYCDIGVKVLGGRRVVALSAIDNLVKGAAGQAVQNMNIMFGLKETLPFF